MPYSPLHLQNLTELKLRVGNVTDTVIATILGLNYPTTEGFSVYVWNNVSTLTPDDNEVVCPTPRLGQAGRWLKVDLLALQFESDPIWNAEKTNYLTENESDLKYLQEFIENDPTVANHIKTITTNDISNWNGKISLESNPTDPEYVKEIQQIDIDSWNEKVDDTRQLTINGTTYNLVADRTWTVGDLSSSGSYANPSWITSLAYGKLVGIPAQVNSDWLSNSGASQILNKPDLSLYYLASNPNAYISNVPAQSWASITGKPSFSTVSTTGNYNDLSNKPTIPTNNNQLTNGASYITAGQVITSLGITPVDITGARNAISLTTTGTSGNATYVPSTGVLNIPNYTSTSKSFNNAAVKTINGAGVQISTTRDAFVTYTVTHTIALTLLLASGSSQVFLEISPNNSTWTTISQAGYSDGVAVAVALTKTTTNNVQGMIPAGNYVRLRSVVSGGGSTTFTNGQEVLN